MIMKGLGAALLAVSIASAGAHNGALRATGDAPTSISKPVVHAAPMAMPVAAAAVVSKHTKVQAKVATEVTDNTNYGEMAKVYTDQAMSMGAKEMMHFLMAQGHGDMLPKFNRFLPQCISHAHRIMRRVDLSYTDEQLHTVLINECKYEKTFPNTQEDGFEHDKACAAYADDLTHARDLELQDPEGCGTCGYKAFCTNYYKHKGGKIDQNGNELGGAKKAERKKEVKVVKKVEKKEKKEKKKEDDSDLLDSEIDKTDKGAVNSGAKQTQASWMPFFLIAILVIVGVALCYLKKSRGGS